MVTTHKNSKKASWWVLLIMVAVNILVLGMCWYYIPSLRRPLDVILPTVMILGVVNAVVIKNNIVRYVCLLFFSTALSFMALEFLQKYFNILGAFSIRTAAVDEDEDARYSWRTSDPGSYLTAYNNALKDGVVEPEVGVPSVEEFFKDVDMNALLVNQLPMKNWRRVIESTKPLFIPSDQLGFELNPDCLAREHYFDFHGNTIHDAKYTINRYGYRHTRSNENADESYVFVGCSFTFGFLLSENETLPHYFSAESNFSRSVINLGVSSWGPHQSLRDLEIGRHLDKHPLPKVKRFFFTLIDDLPKRMLYPYIHDSAPEYILNDDGEAEFLGQYSGNNAFSGRLEMILETSRIYPVLRERLQQRLTSGELPYSWALAISVLKRMEQVCEEKYNAPLTVIYWHQNPVVISHLKDSGLDVIFVSEIFGENWRSYPIKYFIFDLHPNANANRIIAKFLTEKYVE